MTKQMKPESYIKLGIPALFFIGTLFHFIYSFTGELFVVGLFSPVNESVFEHTKMVALPIFLWWSIYYLFRKDDLRADAWFTAALVSMITAIISIPILFYFYTESFGFEWIAVDVLILLAAVVFGQLLGLHYYRHSEGIDYRLALVLMIGVIVLFAIFTIAPPELPLFRNSSQ